MRRELTELQHHRLNDRFHAIEVEQRRSGDATFNLSRQVASLEKLHISMLELLEDVADLQTKVDTSIPDLKHEISKMEFSAAQQTSELNLVREEGRNTAKSMQAIAVSMSQLQQKQAADGSSSATTTTTTTTTGARVKVLEQQVDKLQHEMEKIRLASALHKDIAHSRINKVRAVFCLLFLSIFAPTIVSKTRQDAVAGLLVPLFIIVCGLITPRSLPSVIIFIFNCASASPQQPPKTKGFAAGGGKFIYVSVCSGIS